MLLVSEKQLKYIKLTKKYIFYKLLALQTHLLTLFSRHVLNFCQIINHLGVADPRLKKFHFLVKIIIPLVPYLF